MPQNLASRVLIGFLCIPMFLAGRSWADGERLSQPRALEAAGITAVKQLDPRLDGNDIHIGVVSRSMTYRDGIPQNDYRPNAEHTSLADASIRLHDDDPNTADTSGHSTALCSILFGSDPNGYLYPLGDFDYQGALPRAEADVFELWHFLTNYVFTRRSGSLDMITASFGHHFQDWWTDGIDCLAEQNNLIVIAAIGNGRDAHDPALYPGACANVIGVGVVDSVRNHDPNTMRLQFNSVNTAHTSQGPSSAGLAKPDLVAPGNCLAADEANDLDYLITGNYSSFAAPVVAGAAGLLMQKARLEPLLADAFEAPVGHCLMKALLVNSARKLPFWRKGELTPDDDHTAPLDPLQGAGMLDAENAHELLISVLDPNTAHTGWDIYTLDAEQPKALYAFDTNTVQADRYLTATLVWDKHYSDRYPFDPLTEFDTNLRLELWAVDANQSRTRVDYSDSPVDFLEHLTVPIEPRTSYELIVSFSDPNTVMPQTFEEYAVTWQVTDGPDKDDIGWYDLNNDGRVDVDDVIVLMLNTLKQQLPQHSYLKGDINGDHTIDSRDVSVLIDRIAAGSDAQ